MRPRPDTTIPREERRTDVLHVGGLGYAGEKDVVERLLERRPGVIVVAANRGRPDGDGHLRPGDHLARGT